MGGGSGDGSSAWLNKPLAPPVNLRELEQLRMLVMYEFQPPPSTPELLSALRACGNRTREAYLRLKATHAPPSAASTPSVPTSAPAAATGGVMRSDGTPEREKRRMSTSPADNDAPNKKRKDRNSLSLAEDALDVMDTDEAEEKDPTPPTLHVPVSGTLEDDEEPKEDAEEVSEGGTSTAQRVLVQAVEDRVAGRQPLRHPEWVRAIWSALQVSAELELAMKLNLAVEALAVWVKKLDGRETQAQHQTTQGVALVLDVAVSLPHVAAVGDHVACTPSDAALATQDEEVKSVMHSESDAWEKSAFARAGAAKEAIACLSAACKQYMTRLDWVRRVHEQNDEQQAAVRQALASLDDKLTELTAQSSREVQAADKALQEAKGKKEARSTLLLAFVDKRRAELVEAGESQASATLQSTVEIRDAEDDEVRALWSAREENGVRVAECLRAQQTANSALAFYQKLLVLYRSVRERRETALQEAVKQVEKTRSSSEARATWALETYVPMLTGALFRYYEFHSMKQAKAKEEQLEKEKELEAHVDLFGDSAPIRKDDIEKRIHEFSGVITSSTQVIREIAADQCKLWEVEQELLPKAVRQTLVREFEALWKRLSGPMRDVMRNVVKKMEENLSSSPKAGPAGSPVFVPSQQLPQPVFTVPAFAVDGPPTVTTYRTAISAVVAPSEGAESMTTPHEDEDEAMTPSGDAAGANEWVSVSPASAPAAIPAATTPMACEGAKEAPTAERVHEFEVGTVLYSKFAAGESSTQFLRGQVMKLLNNGNYQMQYGNGDKFTAPASHLFTKEQMEEDLRVNGSAFAGQDVDMESGEAKAGEGGCAIM